MKRILLSLLAIASIAFAKAQTATPTTVIKTVIPFEQTDETPWITRYQGDINYYQKESPSNTEALQKYEGFVAQVFEAIGEKNPKEKASKQVAFEKSIKAV